MHFEISAAQLFKHIKMMKLTTTNLKVHTYNIDFNSSNVAHFGCVAYDDILLLLTN